MEKAPMQRFATWSTTALLGAVVAFGAACGGGSGTAATQPTTAPAPTTVPAAKAASPTAAVASPTAAAKTASPVAKTASPAASPSPAAATGDQRTYEIQQDSSTARFVIDEVLRGSPFTVVGTTNQITGTIEVNPTSPQGAQISPIQIDARSFETDDTRRDGAIQRWVLETVEYPEITFRPTNLQGLPATGAVGQTYNFEIIGDLTVHGVTQQETFETSLTATSPTRLEGQAQTTISFADYGIQIPQVPIVSGVADTVRLELDFVATSN